MPSNVKRFLMEMDVDYFLIFKINFPRIEQFSFMNSMKAVLHYLNLAINSVNFHYYRLGFLFIFPLLFPHLGLFRILIHLPSIIHR